MNVITDTIEAPEDEISLLDIAVAIAESWRILVFGPIVVGLCVFGFLFFTQQDRYASSALLQITQGEAALLESASVVDPALEAADWVSRYGNVAEARREFLEKSLKTEKVGETEYFRVTVEDRSPESARAMLTALISELIRNSVPRDEARRALEQKLETLERSAESMRESLERQRRQKQRGKPLDFGDSDAEGSHGQFNSPSKLGRAIARNKEKARQQEDKRGSRNRRELKDPVRQKREKMNERRGRNNGQRRDVRKSRKR